MSIEDRLAEVERRLNALESFRRLPIADFPTVATGTVETIEVGGERVVTGVCQLKTPTEGLRRDELPYPPHHAGPLEEYGLEDDMRLRR